MPTLTASEIASTLGHELNQPLGTVVNVLRAVRKRLAQADDPGLASIDQGLQMALDQAVFASRIVTRLRDYAQARQPHPELINLADVVQESLALLDWEVHRDAVRVDIAAADAPCLLMADRLMLQQLFVNLMRNAIEAMRDEPADTRSLHISLAVSAGGRDVELGLRDSGCGVADESRLFEPFHSSKPDGMGMGLNICRSFVELHQGRLWFTRNRDHGDGAVGTTVHVSLPLYLTTDPGDPDASRQDHLHR